MSARVRKGPCRVACTPQPDGTVRDVRRVELGEVPRRGEVAKDFDQWPMDKTVHYTPEARQAALAAREAESPEGLRARVKALEARLVSSVATLEAAP